MADILLPRRYTFKLLAPKLAQAAVLVEQSMMVADLWNALLQRQEDTHRRAAGPRGVRHADGKSHLTYFDLTAEITTLRQTCPEWAELSVWTPHRVARALDEAFKAFFRRARAGAGAQSGYPRYRRRAVARWLPHRFASGCRMTCRSGKNWRLTLKGVPGELKLRGQFPVEPVGWTDADLREHAGAWWFSIGVYMPPRRERGEGAGEVRLDLIDEFAAVRRLNGGRAAGPEAHAVEGRICTTEGVRNESRREGNA